ncbi:MAG: hypothetical protein EBT92_07085 [Planctomycetes bacterium]|nr:hypothetical protein [Planctomycetota bacterium]
MPVLIFRIFLLVLAFVALPSLAHANPPTLSYLFPSGGQRGKEVEVRVGGLFLHSNSQFEILGPGISHQAPLKRIPFLWFDGPLLTLSESQQAEDYPKELATIVRVDKDAPLSKRLVRVWNSEGAHGGWKFELGDFPEIIEKESEHYHIPTPISLPITINGRIYPKNDFDDYQIKMNKGETIDAFVAAEKLGSPLDARLEILNSKGEIIAENDDASGVDPALVFTAPISDLYLVRIRESAGKGSPAHVYRLSVSKNSNIKSLYPLGAKSNSKTKFEVVGSNLNFSSVQIDVSDRVGYQPFPNSNLLFDVGNAPEYLENAMGVPSSVINSFPCAINGKILKVDEIDSWQLELEAGQKLHFESRGLAIGSPCRPKISIADAMGKELGSAISTSEIDPVLLFNAPVKGRYTLKIAEEIPARAGSSFAYRILVHTESSKKINLHFVENSLTLLRNGEASLNLKLERPPGFDSKVDLNFGTLPAGLSIIPPIPSFAKGISQLSIKIKATAETKIESFLLGASATIPDQPPVVALVQAKPNDLQVDKVRVAVALPCPFKIVGEYNMKWGSRGGTLSRKYKLERSGYDGPVTVEVADKQARHLQGVYGVPKIIPAGAVEFEYEVQLGPWMEIGRTSRICVAGVATIKDQGIDHIVSYSSVNPNEQMIAVLESGKLDVSSASPNIGYESGKTTMIQLEIFRAPGLTGDVTLETLSPDWTGIKNITTIVKADCSKVAIEIPIPSNVNVPFPVFVKSNLKQSNSSHEARLKLEMIPKASFK